MGVSKIPFMYSRKIKSEELIIKYAKNYLADA